MTIHNPAGVSLTPQEIAQGWRIPSIEELHVVVPMDAEFWNYDYRQWDESNYKGAPITLGNIKKTTYRTRTPPPAPPDELDALVNFLS